MRTISFDFRVGSGAPTSILYGEVTIYGTEQAANGSGWVVTSETVLPLVNGQATLVGALERPVGGSRGHLHAIVRDQNSGTGASYRKYLPVGASPVAWVTLPDAWQDV